MKKVEWLLFKKLLSQICILWGGGGNTKQETKCYPYIKLWSYHFLVLFILYFNVHSFSKVHSLAIYFSQACKDQDSGRTNCIHSFSWPSMKLVACLVHSNRGEKEAFIFICPYPTGNQASGQKAMKSLFRRHLARLNGKKFTRLICPEITMCSFQT